MSSEEKVKQKWPDAELSSAFVVQSDKSRRWMWCVMSNRKFLSSRSKRKVLNVGSWHFSKLDAWASAAKEIK